MRTLTKAEILAELCTVEATINAAYWTFTRTARGKPPCLVVPEAYARRRVLWEMLRRRKKKR